MTREEAIKIIYCYDINFYDLSGEKIPADKLAEAFDLAIEALSKPIVDITQRDLCADISCTDCPFMEEACKLMDYVAYADRPHGEWAEPKLIYTDAHKVTCTNCGERVVIVGRTNFCPNCGADMRKEKECL